MKDDSVEIRTSIQEQGSGTHSAARERRGGSLKRYIVRELYPLILADLADYARAA
jgi:hypothetical protein